GSRTDARRQQQFRKINWSSLGGCGKRAVQPADKDVLRPYVVVSRHDKMRQKGLTGFRLGPRQRLELGDDATGSEFAEQLELGAARGFGAPIGQVDDLTLGLSVDRAVRLIDKTCKRLGVPVISSRLSLPVIHALLDDGPFAVSGHEEAVQIEVE